MTQTAYELEDDEQRELAASIPDPEASELLRLSTPNGVVELPPPASAAVRRLLEQLAAGLSVYLVPADAEMTTTEAGAVLGVSRTYVTRLIDTGKLPGYLVGTHRRLRVADVLAYKARRDRRLSLLDEVTAADQEAGVPYH